ncbi:hypothetical protein [Eubacterium ventriosum]|uniref:hypothetical protein n=1 Tax=Eubacterium ventriosum TaxID=39496 RepID=UPI0002E7D52A|nr:hypothetical protein [Eubacterium ventriosum]MBS5016751.1 hypothetical protein [Eubacterium ventriosum]MBT9697236.1 hypothetical protein [Eubacterium ventriosum]UWP36212.1 hypothetical protein NQ558_01185 [Eubacterium ventriosum]
MKNGTMFNTLHKFEDKDFFKKHSKVYIYTPKRILEYTILSQITDAIMFYYISKNFLPAISR